MDNKMILSTLNHTWILDLDGTIVKHNGYKLDGRDTLLDASAEFLKTIPKEDMIIFITSRKEGDRERTENFLKENGIRYDAIIFNAPYGERILMNDRKPSGLEMSKNVALDRDAGIRLEVIYDAGI